MYLHFLLFSCLITMALGSFTWPPHGSWHFQAFLVCFLWFTLFVHSMEFSHEAAGMTCWLCHKIMSAAWRLWFTTTTMNGLQATLVSNGVIQWCDVIFFYFAKTIAKIFIMQWCDNSFYSDSLETFHRIQTILVSFILRLMDLSKITNFSH